MDSAHLIYAAEGEIYDGLSLLMVYWVKVPLNTHKYHYSGHHFFNVTCINNSLQDGASVID